MGRRPRPAERALVLSGHGLERTGNRNYGHDGRTGTDRAGSPARRGRCRRRRSACCAGAGRARQRPGSGGHRREGRPGGERRAGRRHHPRRDGRDDRAQGGDGPHRPGRVGVTGLLRPHRAARLGDRADGGRRPTRAAAVRARLHRRPALSRCRRGRGGGDRHRHARGAGAHRARHAAARGGLPVDAPPAADRPPLGRPGDLAAPGAGAGRRAARRRDADRAHAPRRVGAQLRPRPRHRRRRPVRARRRAGPQPRLECCSAAGAGGARGVVRRRRPGCRRGEAQRDGAGVRHRLGGQAAGSLRGGAAGP